jgi:hypothetical protein
MKTNLKNLLRKVVFLLCSAIIHLILLVLFKQVQLGLRHRLKIDLSDQWVSGVIMNLVSASKSTANSPLGGYFLDSSRLRQPLKKALTTKIDLLRHQNNSLLPTAARRRAAVARPILNRPEEGSRQRLLVRAKQSTAVKTAIRRNYILPPNPTTKKELSPSLVIERIREGKPAAGERSLLPRLGQARSVDPAAAGIPATGNVGDMKLTEKLARVKPTHQDKGEKRRLTAEIQKGRERSLYRRRVSRMGKRSAKAVGQVGLTYTQRPAPRPVRRQILPQELNYGPNPKPRPKQAAAPTLSPNEPYSVRLTCNLERSNHLNPAAFKAKIASRKPVGEKRLRKQSRAAKADRRSSFNVRQRVKISSPDRKHIAKFQTPAASTSLVERPATPFSHPKQLAALTYRDIARRGGAKRPSTPDRFRHHPLPAMQWKSKPEPAAWTTYVNDKFSSSSYVRAITLDKYKHKWFGMDTGVVRYNNRRWISYTSRDGLVSDQVYAIVLDRQGRLWFGTQGGVSRFDGVEWVSYTMRDGLVDNRVNAVVVDGEGRLWFGTQAGVSRFDNDYWLSFSKQDGLASNKVYAVLVESSYRKWFGTDAGVSELTEEVGGRVYH